MNRIDIRNFEDKVLADPMASESIPGLRPFVHQWNLGRRLPAFVKFRHQAVLEGLKWLARDGLKQARDFYGQDLQVEAVSYLLVTEVSASPDGLEDSLRNLDFRGQVVPFFDGTSVKVTVWR